MITEDDDCPVSRSFVISTLRKSFSGLNARGGRYLTVDNVYQVIHPFGLNPAEESIMDLIREAHLQPDGTICFEDFDRAIQKQIEALDEPIDECVRNAFRLLDYDNNGYITIPELFHMFGEVGEMLDDHDLYDIVKSCDIDGDGRLDLEDFFKFLGYEMKKDEGSREGTPRIEISQPPPLETEPTSLWAPAIEMAQLSQQQNRENTEDSTNLRPTSSASRPVSRRSHTPSVIEVIREAENSGLLQYRPRSNSLLTVPSADEELSGLLSQIHLKKMLNRPRSRSFLCSGQTNLLDPRTYGKFRPRASSLAYGLVPQVEVTFDKNLCQTQSLQANAIGSLLTIKQLEMAIKCNVHKNANSTPNSRRSSLISNQLSIGVSEDLKSTADPFDAGADPTANESGDERGRHTPWYDANSHGSVTGHNTSDRYDSTKRRSSNDSRFSCETVNEIVNWATSEAVMINEDPKDLVSEVDYRVYIPPDPNRIDSSLRNNVSKQDYHYGLLCNNCEHGAREFASLQYSGDELTRSPPPQHFGGDNPETSKSCLGEELSVGLGSTPDSGFAERTFGSLIHDIDDKLVRSKRVQKVVKGKAPKPVEDVTETPRESKKTKSKFQPRKLGTLPYCASPVNVCIQTHPSRLYRQDKQGKCLGMGFMLHGSKIENEANQNIPDVRVLPRHSVVKKCPQNAAKCTSSREVNGGGSTVPVARRLLTLQLQKNKSRDTLMRHQSLSRSLQHENLSTRWNSKGQPPNGLRYSVPVRQSIVRLQLPDDLSSKPRPKKLSRLSTLPFTAGERRYFMVDL